MFTGLVQSLAEVVAIEPEGPGVRLTVRDRAIAEAVALGDSVSVNGCCLTVVAREGVDMAFQAGEETLSRTTLGELKAGDRVNLEPSLRAGDQLGGHYVAGHVDCVGVVDAREEDSEWAKFYFQVPAEQIRQMASKGSVAVDGVSLTLVDVEDNKEGGRFSVALIPHTLGATTIGARGVGDRVNIETDLLAKYVERQLAAR
ncbi:Riboflavin synthase [Pseudobythopirellula maris]|uniref:Riboflavin synthase n=1 Tax=Pseudobythopirellula maris TaxID=2527991 RepID=A0A5C5ZHH7_9BACT|nr:riboflavin synthase [Pseudobythopirellula maris]TWT86608.1 Riboflavin synthase [Pseudobythopirellula maris]